MYTIGVWAFNLMQLRDFHIVCVEVNLPVTTNWFQNVKFMTEMAKIGARPLW